MSDFMVFLGAGASKTFGIPTMSEMAEQLEASLHEKLMPYVPLFDVIKSKLLNYKVFDIEALITVLQDILEPDKTLRKLFNQPSLQYFSYWSVAFDKMLQYAAKDASHDREHAVQLLNHAKQFVADVCKIKHYNYDMYWEFFSSLVYSLSGHSLVPADSERTIRLNCVIFTTNYDLVLEAFCHNRRIEYYSGQDEYSRLHIQHNDRLFDIRTPEFKILKLHGSINWYVDENDRLCWSTESIGTGQTTSLGDKVARELLIYPVAEKYTFREPFYDMFHHLKSTLTNYEICVVAGYSFRDDDILGLFHDALELNSKLSIYIIDPKAHEIQQEKFQEFSRRIKPIPYELPNVSREMLLQLDS